MFYEWVICQTSILNFFSLTSHGSQMMLNEYFVWELFFVCFKFLKRKNLFSNKIHEKKIKGEMSMWKCVFNTNFHDIYSTFPHIKIFLILFLCRWSGLRNRQHFSSYIPYIWNTLSQYFSYIWFWYYFS